MGAINVLSRTGGFCPEYKAVYNAMTVKPSDQYSNAYNRMVKSLVNIGVWPKIKAFDFFATHDRQSALLNWKNINFKNPTQNNTPTFTELKGYKAIQTGAHYIKTNFIPSTDGLSLNNAGIMIGIMDDAETAGRFGCVTASSSYIRIAPRFDANGVSYFDINDSNGGNSLNVMLNSSKKHFGVMRSVSTGFDTYINLARLTKSNSPSTTIPDIEPFLGANHAGSTGTPSFYDNNRHYSYVMFTEALTELEYTGAVTAIDACLKTLGNQLIPDNTFNLAIDGHSFTATDGSGKFTDQVLGNTNNLGTQIFGTGGATISRLVEHQAALDACLKVDKRNVLVIWIGVNDVGESAGSGTSAYNNLKSYLLNRKTAGWTDIFTFTITPTDAAGRGSIFESERVIFNNLVRTDLTNINGINILDTDTVPQLNDYTNVTYFSDRLHPTPAGAKYAVQMLLNKMTEIGLNN